VEISKTTYIYDVRIFLPTYIVTLRYLKIHTFMTLGYV